MKVASIEAVAHALNDAGVNYIVVGGLAVVAHGYGRLTHDLDLVIQLDRDVVMAAFQALAGLGYRPTVPVTAEVVADPGLRGRMLEEKGMTVLNFQSDAHRDMPIDVFVTEPFDFATEFRSALVLELARGLNVPVIALESLLRMKLAAGRPQDHADVAELRRLHGVA